MPFQNILISLSGGMDSATVLAVARDRYPDAVIHPVCFQYGSTHNPYELECALKVCGHYRVVPRVIDLGTLMKNFTSALMASSPVPEGHYEEETMRQTVVPGRNTIFTSLLLGIAESEKHDAIFIGIHQGDHFIYPDCRPEWFAGMKAACEAAAHVALEAPFLGQDKRGILKEGFRLGVPYGLTRTCYKPQPMACGKCGSCQERLTAFAAIGKEDPISYESRDLIPQD